MAETTQPRSHPRGKHESSSGARAGSGSRTTPPAKGGGRRGRHVRFRRSRVAGIVAAVLVLLIGIDLLAFRGQVHPRVAVGSLGLGGSSLEATETALTERAAALADDQLLFRWSGTEFATTPAAMGWTPDPVATAQAAHAVGRNGAPWMWVLDRGRAWLVGVNVPWKQRWDREAVSSLVDTWSDAVGVPAKEGRVWIEGLDVMSENPVAGREIDQPTLLAAATDFVNARAGSEQELPVVTTEPATTRQGVALAREQAAFVISDPIRVEVGASSLSLTPRQLAKLFETQVIVDTGVPQPAAAFSVEGVERLLAPYREDVERAPVSAEFVGKGRNVQIKPSRPGRVIDAEIAAGRLLQIALSEERRGKIPLVPKEAEFTTEEANALGIKRKLASFTTYFTPGEPRTTNIKLGAAVMDGTIVQPGKRFSMNATLGERTIEKGYVAAPAIVDGQFGEQVGGGISQLTTTAFNTIFFAGFPFDEYQAHSIYIDRYPLGREATLHWQHPDLAFTNDTKHPVVIEADTTSNSVTVAIYGVEKEREVTATEPEITDRRPDGYTVRLFRVIEKDGKVVAREPFITYYNNLVESSPTPSPR